MSTEKTAAIVTINRPCDMTNAGRRRIGKWLRKQAGFLERKGDKMAKRYTARYIYIQKEQAPPKRVKKKDK